MFDAEIYAITGALSIVLKQVRAQSLDPALQNPTRSPKPTRLKRIVIFTDAQMALKRCRHNTPGPGQCLAIRSRRRLRALKEPGREDRNGRDGRDSRSGTENPEKEMCIDDDLLQTTPRHTTVWSLPSHPITLFSFQTTPNR